MEIKFILNGAEVSLTTDHSRRLLDILREDFGLTAAKEGCGEGECGACAVLLDNLLVDSCLVVAAMLDGKEVLTLEGYKATERFQAIKRGFEQAGSVQCGFCTPGFVLAAEALLTRNPQPSEEEVRKAIEGNICRCTGYNMIVDGILAASREGEGLW